MAWLACGTTTLELREGELIVGGGADADWRVSTADLMPRHFVIQVRGPQATVRSSSADTVVVVNGRQVVGSPQLLADGDVILAGSGRFAYTYEAPRQTPIDEAAPEQAYLVDDRGNIAHPLVNRSTPIGRDATNAIVVRDPTASRFHAEVRREAGGFALHSMGATGTILNTKPVAGPCVLTEGDTVELAFTTLRFTRQAPAADVTIAPPHPAINDDAARKPTLGSHRSLVDEDNPASRHTRKVQVVVVLVLVALAALALAFAT